VRLSVATVLYTIQYNNVRLTCHSPANCLNLRHALLLSSSEAKLLWTIWGHNPIAVDILLFSCMSSARLIGMNILMNFIVTLYSWDDYAVTFLVSNKCGNICNSQHTL
jgi:hypothetical protein